MNAASGQNIQRLRVDSAAFLEARPGEEDRYGRLDAPKSGTRFSVRFASGDRKRARALTEILTHRCRYCSATVTVNGRVVSEGLSLVDGVGTIEVKGDHLKGVAGLVPDLSKALMHLVVRGLWIRSEDLRSLQCPPGHVVVVESAAFRKDASHANIVKDETYEAARQLAYASWTRCIGKAKEQLKQGKLPDSIPAQFVVSYLRSEKKGQWPPTKPPAP